MGNHHGMCGTRFYRAWANMLNRCISKNKRIYHRYAGRGIKVCKRWHKFENFRDDMLPTYKEDLTLDRTNNNKGYSKANCRWVSILVNNRNTCQVRKITYKGKTQCLAAWSQDLGITGPTLIERLKNWPFERAITTPNVTVYYKKLRSIGENKGEV